MAATTSLLLMPSLLAGQSSARRAGAGRVFQQFSDWRSARALRTAFTVSVVVEVHEHVLAGSVPFVRPLGPPAQVLDRVGTRVQVVRIGAVQADVHERRCCSKHTREVRATHDAIRDRVVLEHREHMFIGPARMANSTDVWIHCGSSSRKYPSRASSRARSGPSCTRSTARLSASFVPTGGDPLDPSLRRVELLGVGETSRRLHREPERTRQPALPRSKRCEPRPAVEAAI